MKKPEDFFNKNSYQVFLMSCPCTMPVSFARHNWFVLNKKGVLTRWESGYTKDRGIESWGHLRKNDLGYSEFGGIYVFPFTNKLQWKGTMIFVWEGESALKIIRTIEESPSNYPYCYSYSPLGPNSNSYAQWVINQSGQDFKLSINSIGKNYFKKLNVS